MCQLVQSKWLKIYTREVNLYLSLLLDLIKILILKSKLYVLILETSTKNVRQLILKKKERLVLIRINRVFSLTSKMGKQHFQI